MKTLQLASFAFLLQTSLAQGTTRVPTRNIPAGSRIHNDEIHWTDPNCDRSQAFPCDEITRRCYDDQKPSVTPDRRHFACCRYDQQLRGSPDSEFHCCPVGHEVVGSAQVGYQCCPAGETFNGLSCQKVCKNGRELVNGECICPPGTIDAFDGTCQKKPAPHCSSSCQKEPTPNCSSGLTTGKCYAFKAENGNQLGHHNDGKYYADEESQQSGKFQVCKDASCTPGLPVNPSDSLFIRDIHTGPRKSGYHSTGQWLSFSSATGYVYRQDSFSHAGEFSLSKWPCGKHCLGGFDWGLGPVVPSNQLALSIYQGNDQMCVPFELSEVPCDIHSDQNNCVWRSGKQQCCGYYGCTDREL